MNTDKDYGNLVLTQIIYGVNTDNPIVINYSSNKEESNWNHLQLLWVVFLYPFYNSLLIYIDVLINVR